MAAERKRCAWCGAWFKPCATRIDGVVTWRRRFCSAACFQAAMSADLPPQGSGLPPAANAVMKFDSKTPSGK